MRGKGEASAIQAFESIQAAMPFRLGVLTPTTALGIYQLVSGPLVRRARHSVDARHPYKKDDNTHIEQKNWTQTANARRLVCP